jgi:hypothetical protein
LESITSFFHASPTHKKETALAAFAEFDLPLNLPVFTYKYPFRLNWVASPTAKCIQ